MLTRLTTAVLVTLALVASSCTAASSDPTTTVLPTSSATVTTTTTVVASTTTSSSTRPPPTTSTEPPELVTATGDLPDELLDRVGELYSWLADKRSPDPAVTREMRVALSAASRPYAPTIEVSGTVRAIERSIEGATETHAIGVLHIGDDTLIATNDGEWEVVAFQSEDIRWFGGARFALVLGSDARPGQNQLRFRADSIHVIAFDPVGMRGTILGFPRDAYVEGPIRGFDKFTHQMASAGPEVMLGIANDLTGLPLDGYAVTGFVGFEGLVRALGGLLIDLPRSVNTGNDWPNFGKGLQRLTSKRALQLARSRKGVPGGDFGRSLNQGLIVLAAMDMAQPSGIDAMPRFVDIFFDNAWSDMSTDNLAQFAALAFLIDTDDMQNVVLPGTVKTVAGKSVVVLGDIVDDIFDDLADGWLDNPDW